MRRAGSPGARRRTQRILAVGVGLTLSVLSTAGSAAAEPSGTTQMLCSDRAHPCSIQVGPQQREGANAYVTVTGRPGARVELRVFRLDVTGGAITGMHPLYRPVGVHLGDDGFDQVALPFPPLEADQDAGWALVSTADAVWQDPSNLLGGVVSLAARRPILLGDGYGSNKPVGEPLHLHAAHVIPGTRFAVRMLTDTGTWQDLTLPDTEPPTPASQVRVIGYQVPPGLPNKEHRFQLENLSDPSAVAQEWTATPAGAPVTLPRKPLLTPPALGGRIEGAAIVSGHPVGAALTGLGATAAGLLLVLVRWPVTTARRHRVPSTKASHGS